MRVAIVGAGPAGCHLAHHLAGMDHEILLFDHCVRLPQEAGYEKPCGGGLSPLVGQHFPEVMALPFPRHQPSRVLLRMSDGSQVERVLESEGWATVSRADLGRALLSRALANDCVRHVRQKVIGVAREAEGWQVRTAAGETIVVDFLAGADGVRSRVRKGLVGPIPRQHLTLAVGYYVRGVPDALVFQTYADLEGYLWSFPRPACPERSRGNHASVGIGGRLGAMPARDLWLRVDRFLDEACPGAVKVGRWVGLLPTACDATLWDTPCAGPGWALLGDAAGHVHPLTGEGISYALWSAELLAEAFGRGDPQAYDALWRRHYGQGLVAAGEMLGRIGAADGVYEVVFQLAMAMALPSSDPAP